MYVHGQFHMYKIRAQAQNLLFQILPFQISLKIHIIILFMSALIANNTVNPHLSKLKGTKVC